MNSGQDLLDRIDIGAVRDSTFAEELGKLTGAPVRASPRTRYNLGCQLAYIDPAVSLEILGDDSRRSTQAWAFRDPVLRRLRRGSQGPAFRAAVRRGGSDIDAWRLARLDVIGVRGAEILARANVVAPIDVLRLAGRKQPRERLAKRSGLSNAELQHWALLAELAETLRGAGHRDVDASIRNPERWPDRAIDLTNLLALAGISSIAELVSKTQVPAGPFTAETAVASDLVAAVATLLTRVNWAEAVVVGLRAESRYSIPPGAVLAWVQAARAAQPSQVEPE